MKKVFCIVCEKEIKIRTGTLFCSGECLTQADKDWEKYLPLGEFSGNPELMKFLVDRKKKMTDHDSMPTMGDYK